MSQTNKSGAFSIHKLFRYGHFCFVLFFASLLLYIFFLCSRLIISLVGSHHWLSMQIKVKNSQAGIPDGSVDKLHFKYWNMSIYDVVCKCAVSCLHCRSQYWLVFSLQLPVYSSYSLMNDVNPTNNLFYMSLN